MQHEPLCPRQGFAAASDAVAVAVLGTAPTASALDSRSCTKNITNQWRTVDDLARAAVRSGPGQTYTDQGLPRRPAATC
ncbi:hypothetical protein ACFWM7_00720 [Streptomyces sp. NPDC058375]|uniref:hypothetical protein n=1 Tax=Streptomyces sp. NPDC058375 TaxID=3346467 RepID=UPI003661ED0C